MLDFKKLNPDHVFNILFYKLSLVCSLGGVGLRHVGLRLRPAGFQMCGASATWGFGWMRLQLRFRPGGLGLRFLASPRWLGGLLSGPQFLTWMASALGVCSSARAAVIRMLLGMVLGLMAIKLYLDLVWFYVKYTKGVAAVIVGS